MKTEIMGHVIEYEFDPGERGSWCEPPIPASIDITSIEPEPEPEYIRYLERRILDSILSDEDNKPRGMRRKIYDHAIL